jgi:hypothetical protein
MLVFPRHLSRYRLFSISSGLLLFPLQLMVLNFSYQPLLLFVNSMFSHASSSRLPYGAPPVPLLPFCSLIYKLYLLSILLLLIRYYISGGCCIFLLDNLQGSCSFFKVAARSSLISSCYGKLYGSLSYGWLGNPDGYVARVIFKLRSGVHFLASHVGRYEDVARLDRICSLCCSDQASVGVEDSFHFCGSCSALSTLRGCFLSGLFEVVARVPSHLTAVVRRVISALSPLDITRFMLCAYDSLSFYGLYQSRVWLPPLVPSLIALSFKTIFAMHKARIACLYPS